ncbi:SRPBCC family protein [Algiphilus aromaticivorans]|uniref:SRPBCC family protein n=1 Tax=Algiphilus aromaticivorans TaxID=382454 RepID=UPI0005C140A0|nr:SRPBCC family protein [Algiphilus aromaticivorans]
MAQAKAPCCTVLRQGDTLTTCLHRYIPEHDTASVWRMLTAPEALGQWLAPGNIALRVGGRICLDFGQSGNCIDSTIRELEPERLLSYSWDDGNGPERPLRWELADGAPGTQLCLSIQVPANEDMARAAAGWDAHLEMLLAALEGVAIRFPVDHFMATRAAYRACLAA